MELRPVVNKMCRIWSVPRGSFPVVLRNDRTWFLDKMFSKLPRHPQSKQFNLHSSCAVRGDLPNAINQVSAVTALQTVNSSRKVQLFSFITTQKRGVTHAFPNSLCLSHSTYGKPHFSPSCPSDISYTAHYFTKHGCAVIAWSKTSSNPCLTCSHLFFPFSATTVCYFCLCNPIHFFGSNY